jgi:signal transduction histidine kinase
MTIRLISRDKQLFRLCQEILAELPGERWRLTGAARREEHAPADICLWDFDQNADLPADLDFEQEQRNIFLVHRKQLGAIRDRLPLAAVPILLKPVNKAALRAFLEHALARYKAHDFGNALRADRDEMLQCVLYANLRLQEYDQDRTNFLARTVHDIRAPLTAINGYCALLLGEQLGPLTVDQANVLQRMQHSIKRLERMASAMFQLSAGRHVEQRPNLRKGDLEACVEQALHEIAPFSEEKQIEIDVRMEPPPHPLYFESSQIEQVLINLLENACKFTPRHGSIQVNSYPYFWERRSVQMSRGARPAGDRRVKQSTEPNAFRVDVRDSGPGIAVEHLGSVFEEYTSYGGSKDRSGGGLGLAICKSIINLHHGQIWAEPSVRGALISFALPLLGDAPEPRSQVNAGGQHVSLAPETRL